MKILVVGGTGALGAHAALHLAEQGHTISIGGRNAPPADGPVARFPFLQGDYVNGDYTPARLGGFDAIVFAAGNDPRHVPPGADFAAWLQRANHEAVPAFFRAAREAGVGRAVQLGSFYPQAAPELVAGNVYIQSRAAACAGARAEARPGFDVISVNAPFMVGSVPGMGSAIFEAYVQWATGKLPIPPIAPGGGTAFMSFRSLSEAIEGALLRGESGKAYLVGDQDITFRDFFQAFFDAAGNPARLEVVDQEHPLLPDVAIPQGRGNWVHVDPPAAEVERLGYRRNDVAAAIAGVVAQFTGG